MAKGTRPAKCYRWDSPAYTRTSNNPSTSFITGIPGSKIGIFDMGNLTRKFNTEISVVAKGDVQIRHNALEATRIMIHKRLERRLGVVNYHFRIRVYPHHIMRENVMATGAGADRVQDGMRNAFGAPIGKTARVKKGQMVLSVYVDKTEERLKKVKETLRSGIKKLPGEMKIVVKEIKNA